MFLRSVLKNKNTSAKNKLFYLLFLTFGSIAIFYGLLVTLQFQRDSGEFVHAEIRYASERIATGLTFVNSERVQKIELTSTNLPRVIYVNELTSTMHYGECDTACHDDANWSFAQIESSIFTGEERDFTLDHLDRPRIAADGHFYFCDADCTNSANWTKVTNVYSASARFVSIRTTSAGAPRIASGNFGTALFYAACDVTCSDPLNWNNVAVTDGVNEGPYMELELTSDDLPRIVHTRSNDDQTTLYTFCDASCDQFASWSTIVIDAAGGFWTSLELNASNNPRLVSSSGNFSFCDVTCSDPSNWTTTSTGGGTGNYVRILLDSLERPRIFHSHISMRSCNADCGTAGNWSTSTIISEIGTMLSPAIDSGDNFHFSSFVDQSTTRNLAYTAQFDVPVVVSMSPEKNAVNVSADSNIVIVFDQSLNTSTVDAATLPVWSSSAGLIAGTYSFSTTTLANDTVRFNPTATLVGGDRVLLSVTTGIKSGTGVAVFSPQVYEFRTVTSVTGGGTPTVLPGIARSGTGDAISVQAADFDGDGDLDAAVAGSSTVTIFNNNGAGTMSVASTLAGTAFVEYFAAADLDSDGDIDLAIVDNGNIKTYKNNGSGTFTQSSVVLLGESLVSVIPVDIDGDGDLDLATSDRNAFKVRIYKNDGSGVFTLGQELTYADRLFGGVAFDINNDGDMDLAFCRDTSSQFIVLTNSGTGIYSSSTLNLGISSCKQVAAGDIDGDGYSELVVAGAGAQIINNNAGTLSVGSTISGVDSNSWGAVLGNWNESTASLDLAITSFAGDVRIFANNGAGAFSLARTVANADLGQATGIELADLDGDNDLDVLAVAAQQDELVVIINEFNDVTPPSVTLLQPNGGEEISKLSTHNIIWSAYDQEGEVASIDLEYTTDDLNYNPVPSGSGLENGTYYSFLSKWGTTGSADGEMEDPRGVTFSPSGDIYIIDSGNHRVQKFDSQGNFLSKWGTNGTGNGQFSFPRGIVVDASENIYVADTENHRIQKFDSNGNFLLTWGAFGSGVGQFRRPYDLAIDSSGDIYVVGFQDRRVQKFDDAGTYLLEWGMLGAGPGEFNGPTGVAIDTTDGVYVADRDNRRIQKFDTAGTFVLEWGTFGSNDGEFDRPVDLETDSENNVYVLDQNNKNVQKFTSVGSHITTFSENGTGDGQLFFPESIAVDLMTGIVVVVDPDVNDRAQKFLPGGLFSWSVPDVETTEARIRVIAADGAALTASDDSDAVFSIGDFTDPTITIIEPNGGETFAPDALASIIWRSYDNSGLANTIDLEFTSDDAAYDPIGGATGLANSMRFVRRLENVPSDVQNVAISFDDSFYLSDRVGHVVKQYSSTGDFIMDWGTGFGTGPAEFNTPAGISARGPDLYIADSQNARIQHFRQPGDFLGSWGTPGAGDGQFAVPVDVAVGTDMNVYVVDQNNSRIQKFDQDGNFLLKWGTNGSANGEFDAPTAIAVNSSNEVFVVDSGNSRVQKFTSAGIFETAWGTPGAANGQFSSPNGIAVSALSHLYVADSGNHRVQVFDSNGNFLFTWGSIGSGDGQFTNIFDVAVNSHSEIVTADDTADPIQQFSPGGEFTWTIPSDLTAAARVRATATDPSGNTGQDTSDSVFTIEVEESSGGTAQRRMPPTQPLAKSVEPLSESSARWNFEDTSTNETGFRLVDSTGVELLRVESPNRSYLVEENLLMNTVYSGRKVIAFNENGDSPVSAEFPEVVTLMPVFMPTVVSMQSDAITIGVSSDVLNLKAGKSALQFELLTGDELISSDWVQLPSYRFTGLSSSSEVQVRVRARNQVGAETAWSSFTAPVTVDQKAYSAMSIALSISKRDGTPVGDEPLDSRQQFVATVTVANTGNDIASEVFVNLSLPDSLSYLSSTLTIDGIRQTDAPDVDHGQAGNSTVSAIWGQFPPSTISEIRLALVFNQQELRRLVESGKYVSPVLAADLSTDEMSGVISSSIYVVPDLSTLSVSPTPPPLKPVVEQPVTPPVLEDIVPLDNLLNELIDREVLENGVIDRNETLRPEELQTTTQSSTDGQSFTIIVTQQQNGITEQLSVTGVARPYRDQVEFTGTTTLPNSIVTLIFNEAITVIVRSDASGFWQTYVNAEQLGINPGQTANIRIQAIASSGELRSEIVSVGEVVITRDVDNQIKTKFVSIVSENNIVMMLNLITSELKQQIEENEVVLQKTLGLTAPVLIISSAPLWGYLPYIPTLLYHFITYLIGLLGRKKKGNRFSGVAYDSISKEPLALAIIRVYNKETNQLVSTQVSDKLGRYDFLLPPGTYRLEVKKPQYTFPSQIVSNSVDAGFNHVYQAEQGIIVQEGEITVPDVPLDPANAEANWHSSNIFKKLWLSLQKAGHFLAVPLLFVGALASVVVVASVPENPVNWLLAVMYVILFVLQLKLRQKFEKSWGIVYDVATNAPIPLVGLQLVDPAYGKVMATRLSDYQGRFRFAPEPGKYVLKAEKEGYTQAEVVEGQKNRDQINNLITLEKEGVGIKGDLGMRQI